MLETVLWWIFLLSCVFAFFFSYGMVEDLVCKWISDRQTRKQKPSPRIPDPNPDPRGNGHSDSVLH